MAVLTAPKKTTPKPPEKEISKNNGGSNKKEILILGDSETDHQAVETKIQEAVKDTYEDIRTKVNIVTFTNPEELLNAMQRKDIHQIVFLCFFLRKENINKYFQTLIDIMKNDKGENHEFFEQVWFKLITTRKKVDEVFTISDPDTTDQYLDNFVQSSQYGYQTEKLFTHGLGIQQEDLWIKLRFGIHFPD